MPIRAVELGQSASFLATDQRRAIVNEIGFIQRLAQIVRIPDLAIARDRCSLCKFGWSIRLRDEDVGVRCLRCRASAVTQSIIAVLVKLPLDLVTADACELSALGPLVRYLAPRTRSLATSEFIDGVTPGSLHDGVRCENVEQLSYANDSFDLFTSTEVFEHVADDRRGFAEILRVLRPGGWLVFSVPLTGAATTQERTVMIDGERHDVLPPEYHGDRYRGRQVFCYRNYGNDIVTRLHNVGFHDPHLCDPGLRLFGHARRIVVARKTAASSWTMGVAS